MLASPRSPIRAFTECTVIKFQYDLDTGLSYFIIFQKRKGIDRLEVQLFVNFPLPPIKKWCCFRVKDKNFSRTSRIRRQG